MSVPSLGYSSRSTSASGLYTHEEMRALQITVLPLGGNKSQPTACLSPLEAQGTHSRKVLDERNARLREALKACQCFPVPPPTGPTVVSSWTRFSANRTSRLSKHDLAASELWTAKAVVSDFNPPLPERVHLGVDQQDQKPKPESMVKSALKSQPEPMVDGQSKLRPSSHNVRAHEINQSALPDSSWSTIFSDDSQCEVEVESSPLVFKREVIKRVNTTSLLTNSTQFSPQDSPKKDSPKKKINPVGYFARVMGDEVLSADMLPSAFDSDSEDELDE